MDRCKVPIIGTAVLLFLGIFTKDAYAYLDLGAGSYIFQIVIAFVIGGLYAVKLFWKKLLFAIKNIFRQDKK